METESQQAIYCQVIDKGLLNVASKIYCKVAT